ADQNTAATQSLSAIVSEDTYLHCVSSKGCVAKRGDSVSINKSFKSSPNIVIPAVDIDRRGLSSIATEDLKKGVSRNRGGPGDRIIQRSIAANGAVGVVDFGVEATINT